MPSFRAPSVGADTVLGFQLVVSNGTVDSAPDQVNVTIRARRPVADAGPDQRVNEATVVTLDGARSQSPDGAPLTFSWRQTGGPVVALSGSASSTPRFRAPLVSADTRLTFELVVMASGRPSVADVVTVTVRNLGASVYGTLTVRGRPVPGSEVRLFRSRLLFRPQPVLRTTTDATGFYAFTGLPPGTYWVQAGGVLQSIGLTAGQDRQLNMATPTGLLPSLIRRVPSLPRG